MITKELSARVNSLLRSGDDRRLYFTPFYLQKLLYLYYGEFIKQHDRELPELCFEAWTYGPVVESLYHACKHYGSNEVRRMIPYEGHFYRMENESLEKKTVRAYGKKTFEELFMLTNKEGGAWEKAFNRKPDKEGKKILQFKEIKDKQL